MMEPDPAPPGAPDPPPRRWGVLRSAERWLYLVAFVSLGWCAGTLLESASFERAQQRRLDELRAARDTETDEVERTAAARAEAKASGLVGRLEMPRLGLSAMVSEGTGPRTLRRSVGHVRGSAFPGEEGNVVLAAHRDRHFRPLRDVREGDLARLVTPGGTFEYRVEFATVVDPGSTRLVQDAAEPVLTLVTCYPFHYVGDAPQRFLVRARLMRRAS